MVLGPCADEARVGTLKLERECNAESFWNATTSPNDFFYSCNTGYILKLRQTASNEWIWLHWGMLNPRFEKEGHQNTTNDRVWALPIGEYKSLLLIIQRRKRFVEIELVFDALARIYDSEISRQKIRGQENNQCALKLIGKKFRKAASNITTLLLWPYTIVARTM